jgi:cell pole-organizing protein PopZ
MANEAHKEPTMEEILASIRKIIADDTPAASASASSRAQAEPSREDLTFDNDADLGMFEGDVEEDESEPEEIITGPEFSFEEMLGTARSEPEPFIDETPEPEPEPVKPVLPAAKPRPAHHSVETAMPASPRYANDPLTDAHTADAAAGALGKLISKMDLGSENTIEALVREMLKPMVKEWLDANLARIVEEKVEAEVERIARMAR